MDVLQMAGDQLIEEVKTLRARVAELEARHAMADSGDREGMEETLSLLAAATSAVVGRDFFRSLVRQLSGLLQVRSAFVSQLHETVPGRVRLLALWVGSDFADNFEYDVKGTPCAHVFAQGLAFFPGNVRKLFPKDAWLRENDIESYLAIPLLDSAANPIGHLGVVDRNAMRDDLPRESMLRIFAARAGAELERMRAADELRASQARYQDLYDNAPDMFGSVDAATGTIIQCNQALAQATGYTKEEILGRHISEMYHPDSERDRKKVFQAFVRDGEVRDAELELRRKDGSRICVSLNLSSVRGEQGEVRYSRSIWRDISERKRMREELEQSERRFRTMFESAAIAMALDDEDGKLLETNPAFQRMFGYTAKELQGKSFLDLTHPDDVDHGWKLFQELVAGKRDSFHLEKRYLRQDGTVLSGSVALSAIRDSAGRFQHSVAMVEDITARKNAEEALRASEQRSRSELAELQHIYDAAPVGLCLTDTNLRYLRINKWLADINGISIEDHIGRTLRDIVPEIAESMEPVYRKVVETGQPALDVLATGATPADPQDVRHFMASYYPLKSADGVVWGLSSIVRDVTAHKRAEEELRCSEERYRQLVANIHDALIVDDKQGRLTYANERFFELFGFAAVDLRSIQLEDCVAPLFQEMLRDFHDRRMRGEGAPRQFEYEGRRKDGSSLWLETCVTTLTKNGVVIGTQSLIRDATSRKSAEQELRHREAELAHATRLSAVGELATGIAHELNQPLATIINYAESARLRLARDPGSESEEIGVRLEKIAAQAKRAGDIIHRLRNLLRDKGPQWSIVDLNECATTIQELVKSQARLKGVSVNTQLADDNPAVSADGVQIQQVLLNLVQNGMDAMAERPAEGHTLTISTELVDNGLVRCSVCDSGVGLADDELDILFKPFYSTKSDGLGLGLSVSRWIIEAHGGQISAARRPGGGAVFSFVLPVVRGDDYGGR